MDLKRFEKKTVEKLLPGFRNPAVFNPAHAHLMMQWTEVSLVDFISEWKQAAADMSANCCRSSAVVPKQNERIDSAPFTETQFVCGADFKWYQFKKKWWHENYLLSVWEVHLGQMCQHSQVGITCVSSQHADVLRQKAENRIRDVSWRNASVCQFYTCSFSLRKIWETESDVCFWGKTCISVFLT